MYRSPSMDRNLAQKAISRLEQIVGGRQFELHDDDDIIQTVRCRQLMMIINIEYICVRLNLQTVSKLRNLTRNIF